MLAALRVLIVEDSGDDAALLVRELRRGAWDVVHERVDTSAAMSAALQEGWDLIISDYSLPNFSGPAALKMAKEVAPDIPFILISGAIGEETAVLAMKAGADDYLSKTNLARLAPVVKRELLEAKGRRAARQIAEQLQKRERQLAEALRLGRLGTWSWDIATGAGVWSDEACEIVRGKPYKVAPPFEEFLDRLYSEDRELLRQLIGDPNTNRFARDFRLTHEDGAARFVYLCGDIIRSRTGTAIEIAGMIQDVTERRRIDQELSEAKDAAVAANQTKSEFLANMSHEIRTPMGAILGFADVVIHKDQGKAGRIECVQIIRRNALHLLELIDEILDLSKIEASRMTVERIPCDVPALLAEVVSLMRPRAIEKGLAFAITFDGSIPRVIQTDPLRLRQILINLIGNAVKFTNTGTLALRITDEAAGSENIALCVDVTDSGIGMSPEQLERLFHPFTQADESITRKFGGTGLGLTICRRLAELLHGEIRVTSRIGIGSVFTVKVDGGPSAGVVRLQNLTEAMLPVQVQQGGLADTRIRGRILLAEDGLDNQRLLLLQLGDAGAEVTLAENGQIAVDLATTQPFDLILMDMQMPIKDGYTAATELRRREVTIPIIALTAYAMAEDRDKCLASGCSAYLSKPVDADTLLKTIKRHLPLDLSAPGQLAAAAIVESPPPPGPACPSDRIVSSLSGNPRMRTIIPTYVDGLPSEVGKMINFLQHRDLTALRQVIHQLRGASGGYGFGPVTEPALRAEKSIENGGTPDAIAAEIQSLIDVIRRIDGYNESKAHKTV